ncbi:Formyltransferase [Obba rivulosa]|uniref:methionyl-tRNA formyltransferase n=1 Tax=Obba rivulosa TaxID=1052685 RepID=A0A8E2AW74_9APHY|nr:Formyltransferase [Obba rivulosa]
MCFSPLHTSAHIAIRALARGEGTVSARTSDVFKVLFLGRDEFSCVVLEQLYAASDVWDEISAVTQPDVKTGRRGSQISVSPLKTLAQQLELPVHFIPPQRPAFKTWQPPPPFAEAQYPSPPPNHLLITASFGRILPNSLLELFQLGRRLNVHPSLLPAYRGAAPIQHALMDGLKETGVCVIEMMERKKGIDAGEIWGCSRVPIPEGAMFPALRDTLAREGGNLLVSVLRDMLAGKATSVPQEHDPSASRAPLITADDAEVDFTTMSAEDIVRRHNALSHQKPVTTYLKTQRTLQLHSPSIFTTPLPNSDELLPAPGTAVYHHPASALLIRCANDTILSVPQVKQQDRSLLQAKQWWNGVRPDMRVQADDSSPVQFVNPS